MPRRAEPDEGARAELIRELAAEAKFTMAGLTTTLIKNGVFDDPKHMTELQTRIFHMGAQITVKSILKASKLQNEMDEFYAYERGAGAHWMAWPMMPRRLSRRAYQVLAINTANAGRRLKIFADGHKARFHEGLSSIRISQIAEWDPDSDFPIVEED